MAAFILGCIFFFVSLAYDAKGRDGESDVLFICANIWFAVSYIIAH